MKNAVGARALVRLTVEVQTSSAWGGECTLRQLHDQATEAAVNRLRTVFEMGSGPVIKIVGEPEVVCITTKEQ